MGMSIARGGGRAGWIVPGRARQGWKWLDWDRWGRGSGAEVETMG